VVKDGSATGAQVAPNGASPVRWSIAVYSHRTGKSVPQRKRSASSARDAYSASIRAKSGQETGGCPNGSFRAACALVNGQSRARYRPARCLGRAAAIPPQSAGRMIRQAPKAGRKTCRRDRAPGVRRLAHAAVRECAGAACGAAAVAAEPRSAPSALQWGRRAGPATGRCPTAPT